MESVDKFWEGIKIDESNLIIAAEQNVKIYLYLVIWCKIPNFFAQIWFIQEFTTNYVKWIHLGFYLSNYERALYTLLDSTETQLS